MTEDLPTLDPRRTALLVMDYQRGIVDRLPDPAAQLAIAADAIARARAAGAHVGYVRVAFTDADLAAVPDTNKMFSMVKAAGRAMHADEPATRVADAVAPRPGDVVVRKTRVGGFSTTDLDAQLRERGVDTVILAGISTSGVVLSTVRDASDRDYRVVVLSDASADPVPEAHAFLTERIFPRQAYVATVADLDALWGGDA